jgi:protein-disulfide isomerase
MKKPSCVNVLLGFVLLAVVLFPYPVNPSAALPEVPGFRLKGAAKPAVVITEFSDYQCPSCAKAQSALLEIVDRHPEVVLIFRNYPLRQHRWAFLAAQAAECAGAQGKFWEYQKILFERQSEWDRSENARDLFVEYAGGLGLDVKRFEADLSAGRWDAAILKDIEDAKAKNVNVTPTFFINERRLVGDGQLREYGEKFVEMEKSR